MFRSSRAQSKTSFLCTGNLNVVCTWNRNINQPNLFIRPIGQNIPVSDNTTAPVVCEFGLIIDFLGFLFRSYSRGTEPGIRWKDTASAW